MGSERSGEGQADLAITVVVSEGKQERHVDQVEEGNRDVLDQAGALLLHNVRASRSAAAVHVHDVAVEDHKLDVGGRNAGRNLVGVDGVEGHLHVQVVENRNS